MQINGEPSIQFYGLAGETFYKKRQKLIILSQLGIARDGIFLAYGKREKSGTGKKIAIKLTKIQYVKYISSILIDKQNIIKMLSTEATSDWYLNSAANRKHTLTQVNKKRQMAAKRPPIGFLFWRFEKMHSM